MAERKEELITVRTFRICDVCNCEQIAKRKCDGCQIDLCSIHEKLIDEPFVPYGDSIVIAVCDYCFCLLHDYTEAATAIREKADTEIEEIERSWRKECKNKKEHRSDSK